MRVGAVFIGIGVGFSDGGIQKQSSDYDDISSEKVCLHLLSWHCFEAKYYKGEKEEDRGEEMAARHAYIMDASTQGGHKWNGEDC